LTILFQFLKVEVRKSIIYGSLALIVIEIRATVTNLDPCTRRMGKADSQPTDQMRTVGFSSGPALGSGGKSTA
jgi:hypothetical protein